MDTGGTKREGDSPAEVYERCMVPAVFAPWVKALLDLAALQPGQRLLDVACGTGAVVREAVKRVGKRGCVVGLDINPQMLEVARTVEPSAEWKEGTAIALPFPDQVFDAVTCQQGLQFFPDQLKAMEEMHRVLVPGGRLVVAVWCAVEKCPGYAALLRALERHVGPSAASPTRAIFNFGDSDKLRCLLEGAQYRKVKVQRDSRTVRFPSSEEFVSAILGGSNLARSGVRIDSGALNEIKSGVTTDLRAYIDPEGLAFPMEAYVAVGLK